MIEPNKGPSWPTSEHDHLLIAPDRKVGDVDNAELTARLERLNIPGFSHANGRAANIHAFAVAREKVYDAAGTRAVLEWLRGGKLEPSP